MNRIRIRSQEANDVRAGVFSIAHHKLNHIRSMVAWKRGDLEDAIRARIIRDDGANNVRADNGDLQIFRRRIDIRYRERDDKDFL